MSWRRWLRIGIAGLVALVAVLAGAAADDAACLGCHPAAASAWKTSHHARAQQPATAGNVLGNFDDVWFVQGSRRVRFFRRGEDYLIRTEGPDGQPADFPVRYTLGVYPLQQYLLPLPGGRLQAFDIAWDARPAAEGGQRWFQLEAHQGARPGDPLHWSGRALNANAMCTTCHTTGFRAGYQPVSDTYQSHWDAAGVDCLACYPTARGHGPGRAALPRVAPRLHFVFENGHPIARPQGDPAIGEPGLYFADGQIRDEVFEYGSFTQSAMYRAGVSCTDCHDVHSGRLRAEGNALCAQCHLPSRYEQPAHLRHASASPGGQCVACHMPTRTYMGVHGRHDHRLAIPDPLEAERQGSPQPCAACHPDRPARWAAEALARTRAAPLPRTDEAPWRARLLASLPQGWGPLSPALLAEAARDGDGLLRLGAARALETQPARIRLQLGAALLDDPLRAVRIEAVRQLALLPATALSPALLARREAVLDEWAAAEGVAQDRPEARVNLARIQLARQQPAVARALLEETLRRAPDFISARINLADLLRATGQDAAAGPVLEAALARAPEHPELRHAFGLWLVRQGQVAVAAEQLAQAARLAPERLPYAQAAVLALLESGQREAAARLLALIQAGPLAGRPELRALAARVGQP